MKAKFKFLLLGCVALSFASCSDDNEENNPDPDNGKGDVNYVGKAVGNFTAEEWYPGGALGTTDNVSASSYEDETPAVTNQGLTAEFKFGETFFERNFTETQKPFNGLGPAWVRQSCMDCHPGYGHGKRVESFNADTYGNGYLLVIYHPATNGYIAEVTGMPQTRAAEPFLPPIDESQIDLRWEKATDGALPLTFPDGEAYELIYPVITIPQSAFNTVPKPTDYECRLESTIGIYGTGLLDAITEDDLKAQYAEESKYLELNPAMWTGSDWATTAWYTGWPKSAPDQTPRIKRFTYALTRASLQDGPGANAIWNITNVTRSDRRSLYTTNAWAEAMATNAEVIAKIKADPSSPYYADGTDAGIANAVRTLLSPSTDQTNNDIHNFEYEMQDEDYYNFMVWHRGLAVPRARNLNDSKVQRGKEVFMEIGCSSCHRPSWKTGSDNYWADAVVGSKPLPKYANQTIWPYSDMIQHRLWMKNNIKGDWCRTTPLWGRGLSLHNTGAEDRLHDCRARNEIEAIMWHGYSKQSDAYNAAEKFYNLSKEDRDAVVAFLRAI